MFQHNLLVIYRNFLRFKSTFFINLLGLSSGLACALLIYLWVNDELNVDKFYEKEDQLFQVMENRKNQNTVFTMQATPFSLAKTLAAQLPEVEYAVAATPFEWFPKFMVSAANDRPMRVEGKFADKDFFNVFSYTLLHGNKDHVLNNKNSIVISESLAKRLFNTTEDIIGKEVNWQVADFKNQCFVSGVFKDVHDMASDRFDIVMNLDSWNDKMPLPADDSDLEGRGPSNYLILKAGVQVDEFNDKLMELLKDRSSMAREGNLSMFITPYSENYLHGQYENGVRAGGRIEYVKLFSLIAIFIVLIACINFMNLSTAKASRRIKEVGIKKAMGAQRKALVYQYLGESIMMALLSMLIAIIVVQMLLPQFNELTGKHLTFQLNVHVLSSLAGSILLTGLLAGSYPALYLSGFKPVAVLKGMVNSSSGELWARRGLVIFQFVLSTIFIVCVIVIHKQVQFVQVKNLGYNKDNVIYFEAEGKVSTSFDAFIAEIKRIPGIINASTIITNIIGFKHGENDADCNGKKIPFSTLAINYDLLETLGIEMEAGRTYSREHADSASIIFNEYAINTMELDDPVGKVINFNNEQVRIVGVTKDFHFQTLYKNIGPLALRLDPGRPWNVMVRIKTGTEKETIDRLEKFYAKYNPGFPLDYKFLDQEYEAQYKAEKTVATLSGYFTGLAILISCLGLFGLASFTVERRIKEIGIRKVLGASELGIVYLLSGEFTRMVLISITIGLPASYLLTKYWLDNFAYKIELQPLYFISAGLSALLMVWLIVGTQTLKAAKINLSQCLRDE